MTMEKPRSPTSPISPTSAHPLDGGFTPRPPQLQVVTTFPLNSVLGRRTSLTLTTVHGQNPLSTPPIPNPGFRAHRSHRRTSSNISFPSPIEAILMRPLSSLPTPLSAHGRVAIDALLNPTPVHEVDGRQSRMAMRSPFPLSPFSPMSLSSPTPNTAIKSPILEQVVSLPLRVNTAFPTPTDRMDMDSCMGSFSAATTAVRSRPESRTSSRASSRSRWTATHTRSPAISDPPTNALTGTRERSPIRKAATIRRKRSPPPKYHVNVQPSMASTLNGPPSLGLPQMSPRTLHQYCSAIDHLAVPLVPLISVTNGLPHPQFPRSLLQYHLLTHEQLDTLARWYHQTGPASDEAFMYPAWIPPYTGAPRTVGRNESGPEYRPSSGFEQVSLTTKRRRWGRFIGLRGCDSPTNGQFGNGVGEGRGAVEEEEEEEEEGLVERMEREWRNAMRRAREEDMMREKGWRGRW